MSLTSSVSATRVVHAVCSHDCPDSCGVLVTVDELSGRAVKVQGDPSHPVTRGFLCGKVAKYLDRVYSPDRVLRPMRRIAPKGLAVATAVAQAGRPRCAPMDRGRDLVLREQVWRRISWDAALDEIARRLRTISAEFGSEAILPYSYGGTLGMLNGASM